LRDEVDMMREKIAEASTNEERLNRMKKKK